MLPQTIAAVGVLLAAVSLRAGETPPRPNVLLIISDDQAWTDYSFMGHPYIDTPTLDQLAAESLTYTRGYVTSPLCRPSLASILTGLPTHIHGTTGNDPETGDRAVKNMGSRAHPKYAPLHQTLYDRLRAQPNMVRLLRDAGYKTLQTGKWWEANPKSFGFTHAMTHGDPHRGGRHGDEGLKVSREGIAPIREFLDECTANGDDGGSDSDGASPFFIWHAPFLPHSPHTPPERLLAKYQAVAPSEPVARYWAMCEWFDETCSELLKELDDRGLRENTLVLYITDNGWIQDPETANRYAPRSKQAPHEGGVRTPIMVRWPGSVEPALDLGVAVSAIDVAPTILSAAGLDVPETMRGFDLRDREALRNRTIVYGSDHPHNIADVKQPNVDVESQYVVAGPWKLIDHAAPEAADELYHLEADPHERVNLVEIRPEVAQRLRDQLLQWWNDPQQAPPRGKADEQRNKQQD